jgi:beta-lactam-binding protein with PASTA domain
MPSGAALVEVPDLTGNPLETAQQKVREYRLLPLVELVETSGTENTVKRQTPEAGSFLRPGSPVTLYVIVRPAPSPVDEVITRVREAIRQEGLAQKSDLAGLEKETDARKRFEELRSLLPKPGGPKSAP